MLKSNSDITNNKPIYYILKEFYDSNKEELYAFQDLKNEGKLEFEVVTESVETYLEYIRNRLSYNLKNIVMKVIHKDIEISELKSYIKTNPIIYYYNEIVDVFNSLSEDKILIKEVSTFIKKIILNSKDDDLIKLSLLIAPKLNIKDINEIYEVFSIHNRFIFYVIEGYKQLMQSNSKIFEICKKSKGYGRVFCVKALKNTSFEIEDYLVNKASDNEVGVDELIDYSLLSVDIYEYMRKVDFNSKNLEEFSKSLSKLIAEYRIDEIENKINVYDYITKLVEKFGSGIYSLYMLTGIQYLSQFEIIYFIDNNSEEERQEYIQYRDIIDKCSEIFKYAKWKNVIEKSIEEENVNPTIITKCMKKTNYDININEFEKLIKRDSTNPVLCEYALSCDDNNIKKLCINNALEHLDYNKILTGSSNVKLKDDSFKEPQLICLYVILKYSCIDDFEDTYSYKMLNLKSLKCSVIEVRSAAVENLRKIKENLTVEDEEIIKSLIKLEVTEIIKTNLKDLLNENVKTKKSILANKIIMVNEHTKDTFLTNAVVNGEETIDRSHLYDELEVNSILYFAINNNKEPIVVTRHGDVLGYLTDDINTIIKNLINDNKSVYAKIKELSEEDDKIIIKIYLSYQYVIDEIEDTLTLLSLSKNEYMQ